MLIVLTIAESCPDKLESGAFVLVGSEWKKEKKKRKMVGIWGGVVRVFVQCRTIYVVRRRGYTLQNKAKMHGSTLKQCCTACDTVNVWPAISHERRARHTRRFARQDTKRHEKTRKERKARHEKKDNEGRILQGARGGTKKAARGVAAFVLVVLICYVYDGGKD